MRNENCPICGAELAKQLQDENMDYAGRAICTKCADWLENTEWD